MIYTVTISPAIDYVVHLDRLQKRGNESFHRGGIFSGRQGNQCFSDTEGAWDGEHRYWAL